MIGKAPKTNFGQGIQKTEFEQAAGSPSINSDRLITGTIKDVRLPGEYNTREGSGILVQIQFDEEGYDENIWFSLAESYSYFRSSIGNRAAVLKNRPRVVYKYHPSRFYEGYARLITDGKQEGSFNKYERNPSAVYVNVISGLASGVQAPG